MALYPPRGYRGYVARVVLDFVPKAGEPAHFVGAAACAGYHAAETGLCKTSHHAKAMQPATSDTVLGAFNEADQSQNGVVTSFSRSGEAFMVRTEGADGKPHDYPIAYTFGVDPLQQYLIGFPGGRGAGSNLELHVRRMPLNQPQEEL